MGENMKKRTVKIPQDLWNADFNRSPEAFHIEDPLERYEESVQTWLISNGHDFMKGKDKNGFGGTVLVKR